MSNSPRRWRIKGNSFAAPFFSDSTEKVIEAKTSKEALKKFIDKYDHPCGLYSAVVFGRNGIDVEYEYLCNLELEKQKRTAGKAGYTVLHSENDKGEFIEIDDERYYVKNPKKGKIIERRK